MQAHYHGAHPDARPYACDVEGCVKAFASRQHLGKHKRTTHFGELPHVRSEVGCGMAFSAESLLSRHRLAMHAAGEGDGEKIKKKKK